jgi:hypothetical protein
MLWAVPGLEEAMEVRDVGEGLLDALLKLESMLSQSGAAIVPLLHPGIDEFKVVASLQGIGLKPNAEVVTWFGWHDGAGGPGMPREAIELVPGGELYGLDDLCREYLKERKAAEHVAAWAVDQPSRPGSLLTADDIWPRSWFPLLRMFGKGYLAVELAGDDAPCPIHVVWFDSDPKLSVWVRCARSSKR